MPFLSFPRDFLWGTATSAHQVEGQNFNNDWWDWEQKPGTIKRGDSSRVACDWWGGRYEEDFDRARELGQNALRLSIEWSRIEPHSGQFDDAALSRYRDMLTALQERGITPLVTLHHFTNPRWFANAGGWLNPNAPSTFARFAEKSASVLGDLCSLWATINEPNIYAYASYMSHAWTPGYKNLFAALRVLENLVRAHSEAYHSIKSVQLNARVGWIPHIRPFSPLDPGSPLDQILSATRSRIFNEAVLRAFLEPNSHIKLTPPEWVREAYGTLDFIGMNYYYSEHAGFDLTRPSEYFTRTPMSPEILKLKEIFEYAGEVEPSGISNAAQSLREFEVPLYVTENGIFEADPENQTRYLVSHLIELHRAIEEGAKIRGYFWWTLIDNFEWAEGYAPRFGLYRLNIETQERTPKLVASVYARIVKENGIAQDLADRYGRAE